MKSALGDVGDCVEAILEENDLGEKETEGLKHDLWKLVFLDLYRAQC